ncbi:acetyltransferase [Streptomyces sp. C10-9-1]|uniref:GNAT family N-acetyltransferase n=1 Tax=Streptomyces sp. C10-9-1 TaxID=1859285 RepID=UPI0021118A95|nr:GNAT family N-acetyltransferase [Streptomyces sp. C10-9-1]MCQ6555374.1 acetyltransferase [Streptomyces sp. C10-9-1]
MSATPPPRAVTGVPLPPQTAPHPRTARPEPAAADPGGPAAAQNPARPPAPHPATPPLSPAPAAPRPSPAAGGLPPGGSTVPTPAGAFRLVPVVPERDLALLVRWMNDPAVAAFWELAGPAATTLAHLRRQLDGGSRSTPCLGELDGRPTGYFEIYRADLDPLARHYPARPHDMGVHLLIGAARDRGRGTGSHLLRAVADLVLDHHPACRRVVAEPDLGNTPCVAAFLSAGFRLSAEVDLPDKRAALMIRERALRSRL